MLAVCELEGGQWIKGRRPSIDQLWDCHGYVHRSPDLYKPQRTATGHIREDEGLRRVEHDEMADLLEQAGLKKKSTRRGSHPNSRANLRPAPLPPPRPRVLDDETLERAERMRGMGTSWSVIGRALRANPSAIRTALRRREETLKCSHFFMLEHPPKIDGELLPLLGPMFKAETRLMR